jgi:hypothetical protein
VNRCCFFKFRPFFLVTSVAILTLIPFATFAETTARQLLRGHLPSAVARFHLRPVGRLAATNRLSLAIGLQLRNRAALDDLLAQIYDPASPNFRHYLTPEEFVERFGPAEADYEAVIAFARRNGLTVTGTYPDRTLLNVSGSVAEIERTFQVTMRLYQHPREHRNFFAPDVDPSVDAAVPILHISGLDNFIVPHPAGLKMTPLNRAAAVKADYGTGPSGFFMGNDFRAAYVPGVSLNGSNQIVGLFELDGYYTNDITAYESNAGLPNITLTNVLINSSGSAGSNNVEVALDIEMAISMAPGLSEVMVYEGPNPAGSADVLNLLEAMATNTLARQISSSWEIGDDTNFDVKYMQFAAQGQSFFQASGDDGAYYPGIGDWQDDANVTIVGGTTLSTTGPGGPYSSETVWNEYNTGDGTGVSGGGVSLNNIPIPSWQTGINMTNNQGSSTLRNIPDVAMTADNIFAVGDNGQQEFLHGTSAAAPLWAGFAALVNQQAIASGKPTIGFINPAIYAIGKSAYYPADFHDITTGNNTNTTVGNEYFAVPGYDLCTGWGTPAGQNLITALATPDTLGVLPGSGFTANGPVGGTFNISVENFSLTNSGAASLKWAAVTPSWLTATPGSGTLPANGSAAVAVSVNSTTSDLLPATYMANVVFTNLTSGVAQIRSFTLQLGQSLVQNGGFETGDFSLWTFNGDYIHTNGSFENGVIGANNTSNDIGTNWVHSGAYGAAFGQAGSPAYLSQTLTTLPGQSYLLSFWLNNIGGATPNQFLVNWNTNFTSTNTLFDQTNMPAFNNWTNMLFIVTATGTNTALQFGLENDNYYFGLDDIALLPIPTPTFSAVAATNHAIQFTWNSLTGLVYQIQYATNLAPANWNNLGSPVTATDFTFTATNSIGPDAQRFYRVHWVQ